MIKTADEINPGDTVFGEVVQVVTIQKFMAGGRGKEEELVTLWFGKLPEVKGCNDFTIIQMLVTARVLVEEPDSPTKDATKKGDM